MNTHTSKHTPGPWKVMPCPQNAGKHPFHDSRWIATEDAEVERGYDPRSWGLSAGSLICEMRDGPASNARLIAAAPELLAALEAMLPIFDAFTQDELSITTIDEAIALLPQARQAVASAKGEAP